MKKLPLSTVKICVCIVFAMLTMLAQFTPAETLPLKAYTTSEGLAHDRVNRIVRDSRGFLWFCTGEGLSRFDGYEFKNYTQDDGLPYRTVNDLLETKSGEIWVATNDGLVLFDPLGTSSRGLNEPAVRPMFRVIRPDGTDSDPEPWGTEALMQDRSGEIWVGSSKGLYRLKKNDDWVLERFGIPAAVEAKNDSFYNLIEDQKGAIWAGTLYGLYRVSPDRSGAETVRAKLPVESLLEDRDGKIWAGTASGDDESLQGLHIYEYVDGVPKETRVFYQKDGLPGNYWINALRQMSDGRIYAGVGSALVEYTPDADPAKPQFRSIVPEGVVEMNEDAGGNLWFSTNSSGVKRLARHGFVLYGNGDGLKTSAILSIIAAPDGKTYIIDGGGLIHRFNGKNFDTVAPLGMVVATWGGGQVTFLDREGAWWVAGTAALQRYPPVKFEDLAHTPSAKIFTTADGLYSNHVFKLFEDSRGDIWISNIGIISDTLMRWDRSTGKFAGYTTADGLPGENGPSAFGEDAAGNVWIGYYSGGLARHRNGKFDIFTAEDGLPPGYISNIFTDSKGVVWIATSTGGVVRVDDPASPGKPDLARLTTRDGLSSNQVTCTTEDDFGRLYFSSGRGVNRYERTTGRIKIFTKADGLPENMIVRCGRDIDGALWFGTLQGLARYQPVAEQQSVPPPIFLSDLLVNGARVMKLSELGETRVGDLELASDQRQIQVEMFALSFGTGESLRYQYKMDEVDEDWSAPSDQRTVNLSLSAGKYTLLVRAVNAEGVVSKVPASIAFSIARPLWQRWWFIALLTLAISGLIYLIYIYRLRRLIELEKVRTRIATDLHDDIGASLSKIAILSEVVNQRVAPVAPQDSGINEPLNEIAGTSRDLVDSMSDIVWAINPERDHLNDLLQRMRNLASELTEYADIGLKINLSGVEEIGDMPLGADVRREVYLIFKETVNNLVKHSGADRAEVDFKREGDELVITVKDDGTGFDPEKVAARDPATRGGNGLPNMRRRAGDLGGTYNIESVPGSGTTVTLRVPISKGFSWRNLYRAK